jgi:hypothetical protein
MRTGGARLDAASPTRAAGQWHQSLSEAARPWQVVEGTVVLPPVGVARRVSLTALIVLVLGAGGATAFAAVSFPAASSYILVEDDPNDCPDKHAYRDIDKVLVYDDEANQRIFIRYEFYANTGWPRGGKGMFKWAIDTDGSLVNYKNPSGTQIQNEEFFLFVWDNGVEDEIGEVNLSYSGPDGAGAGWPSFIGPATSCGSDCVGTGSTALGGPQIANNNPDVGYRLDGSVIEMYVSYGALGSQGGNPVTGLMDLCLVGVGEATATNYNMDQASSCDSTVNAVGSVTNGVFCGSEPAALTIIEDTVPDLASAEFNFSVQGPSPQSAVLQDPGMSECVDPNSWAVCGTVPPWDREDRVSYPSLTASNHPFQTKTPYRLMESAGSGATLEAFETTWECRNVDPDTCSPTVAAAVDDPFTLAACAAVEPPVRCEADGWTNGVAEGDGPVTGTFDICMGSHVICKFTNTNEECIAADNAIGDIKAIGGVEGEPAGFATAAVPLQSSEAEDSLLLASFIPLEDGHSRWPGMIDHFIAPLPLTENDVGQLVPDSSFACADDEDTGCAAWRASTAILDQAPAAAEVTSDRRIGLAETERRVTYTTHTGTGVPRTIRPFDWSVSDDIAVERDLWDGFNIPHVKNDATSEASARTLGRATINDTLAIREATIADDDSPDGTTALDFVLGDFFHGDPTVVAAPANFFYLANDLEGNGAACDDISTPNLGYRCFWEKHRYRRRVVVGASNDGQVHAFDGGQFEGEVVSQRLDGEFTRGTGKELFAHVPRAMMPHTQKMTADEHHFGVDGALVLDDVFIDPLHGGTPNQDQREWRSVIFGTYREGQRGVFALDVTQPDPVEKVNVSNFAGQPDVAWLPEQSAGVVPECAALGGAPTTGCGTLSYPAQLWEFSDQCLAVSSTGAPSTGSSCDDQLWDFDAQCLAAGSSGDQSFAVACDEDSNGQPDLGYSWSQVNTGRILVNVEGEDDPVVRYVAVFGGGLDPIDKTGIGNWIYMVDIETGAAIYKRQVASAVPSEPAAVDTDQDGFIDTLYVGTYGGLLYKADLSTPADLDATSGRLDDATQWAPFAIFDTGGRPIFFPPTVTYVASAARYALAFGTGDREDLFSASHSTETGRFYLILDSGFQPGVGLLASGPLTEDSFQVIDAFDDGVSGDFLAAPLLGKQPGWVLDLAANERVVTKAVVLSGLLVFTTFQPLAPDVCAYSGNGSVYALQATNANSIAGPSEDRAFTAEGFFGEAVIAPTGMTAAGVTGEQADIFQSARIQGIRDNLMDLFPADCRFGSFSLNVSVSLSNTSVQSVASIPICVARKNWTEQF